MMIDTDIAQWRTRITRGGAVAPADADELEEHLRDQIAELETAGLSDDEAFLVAVKRLGQVDRLTAEFAREHSDRLWKQLVLGGEGGTRGSSRTVWPMVVCAAIAAIVIQVARLVAWDASDDPVWFVRNLGLFLLVPLIAYFAASRRASPRRIALLASVVAVIAVVVNVFPFTPGSQTEMLLTIHLPVVLWFVVAAAYLGGEWRSSPRRMDFIRFSGEWAIYYVLIALGGGVLLGLTNAVLLPIAPDAIGQVNLWVLPSGAAAAVVGAAWLVEAKKNVIENIAPVLTAIFTPLFAVMLVAISVVYAASGVGRDFDRELLIVFDVLLLVVLALVLYGISARDPLKGAGLADVVRLIAVGAALLLDFLVLGSMLARVSEFGLTPNRVAALGLNLVLVVNLSVTVWQSVRLLMGRATIARTERWQTSYLPVFAAWAVLVVVALPPVFSFA